MKNYLLWHMTALVCGYILDLIVGDPHGIPHPVVAIGKLIAALEAELFPEGQGRDAKRELFRGAVLSITVMVSTVLVTAFILAAAYTIDPRAGIAVEAVLTCSILAARSLYTESMKVCEDLKEGELRRARRDLSMIVGRDTEALDDAAVARAAVETVAENTSDGVIAPLIYTALLGPIAGLLYKSVNTMDSMIGYRNERYEYFGRTAAKTDDVVNFIPSRVSAFLLIAATAMLGIFSGEYDAARAFRIWRRDRMKHKSPNSAQTESACAGALGIRLGGPSSYGGILVDKPTLGDDGRGIRPEDIQRSNRLMFAAEAIAMFLIALIAAGIYLL